MRKISAAGIALIKSFEGIRLKAYKAVDTEPYWTIGWGHYGGDVRENQVITLEQADAMFLVDIQKYVASVNALPMQFTQNEFDALVSFCYNCGAGNLNALCTGKSKAEISQNLLLYNKSGGKVLKGLTDRRRKEQSLFLTRLLSVESANTILNYLSVKWNETVDKTEKDWIHTIANEVRLDSGQPTQ